MMMKILMMIIITYVMKETSSNDSNKKGKNSKVSNFPFQPVCLFSNKLDGYTGFNICLQ